MNKNTSNKDDQSEPKNKNLSIKQEDDPNFDEEMKDNINSINFRLKSPKKKDSVLSLLQQPIMKRFSGHLVILKFFALLFFKGLILLDHISFIVF